MKVNFRAEHVLFLRKLTNKLNSRQKWAGSHLISPVTRMQELSSELCVGYLLYN